MSLRNWCESCAGIGGQDGAGGGDLAVAEAQSTGLGGVVGEQALAAADHDGSIMSRISSIRSCASSVRANTP